MVRIHELLKDDKIHWEHHLKIAENELSSKDAEDFLASKKDLPNIKHPADIHDWLEKPDERDRLEETWLM